MNASDIFAQAGADIVSAGTNDVAVYDEIEVHGIFSDSFEMIGASELQIRGRNKTFTCKTVDFITLGLEVDGSEIILLKTRGDYYLVEGTTENAVQAQTVIHLKKTYPNGSP